MVEAGGRPRPVELHRGREFNRVGEAPVPDADGLAPLAAPLLGIPSFDPPAGPLLGEACDVVAGFRDEYYAIAAATREGGLGPRVVTAGRIGPLRLDPDGRPVRIQRRDFVDPRVDLEELATGHPRVAEWLGRLLVPKVLVATQTPVIEAVADPDGTLVPLTPVIAVLAPPDLVWSVAGLLSAPSISALAAARTLGLGRHSRVVKLAAREIRVLPGLAGGDRWPVVAEAARAAQSAPSEPDWRAGLLATARAADEAVGGGREDVLAWWSARLGIENPGAGLRDGR